MSIDLHVYFAPMVTGGLAADLDRSAPDPDARAAQLVGLLFIDAAAPDSGTGTTGFEQLTRALLGWAIDVDPAAGAAALSQLTARRPARTFDDFQAFLAARFRFTLGGPKELKAANPASLAVFPMFPYLQLSRDGAPSTDFGAYKRTTPAFQRFLAAYFQQLAVPEANRPAARPNVPDAASEPESLARSVFTDYFQILVRQVTNDAAQWVQNHAPPPAGDGDRAATFEELARAGVFNVAAGFVSRFLLHGLRIPDPDDGVPADPAQWVSHRLYPLFALTGQTWQAPAIPDDPSKLVYTMSLGAGSLAPPDKLITNLAAPLTVTLADLVVSSLPDGVSLIQAYKQLLDPPGADPLGIASSVVRLAPLDAYTLVPRRYALGKPTAWKRLTTATLIASFTDPLRTQIDQSLTDLRAGIVALGAPANTAPTKLEAITWATRLDFTVRQATAPGGTGSVIAGVYELRGADQDDRHDLFALLSYLRTGAALSVTVELLHGEQSGSGLASDDRPSASVLKANLATQTTVLTGDVLAAADLPGRSGTAADALDFLTLLWESTTVDSGGYYLTYSTADGNGLPSTLFQNGPGATLTVVVTLPQVRRVERFHNAIVLPASGVPDDALFVIEPEPQAVPAGSTLRGLASARGTSPAALGEANATTPFLSAGTSITVAGKRHDVQDGDTLLRIALALNDPKITPREVAEAAADVGIARSGAWLQAAPAWVVRRATLAPGNAGFELLRTNPMPLDPHNTKTQLAAMFSLLGHWVEAAGGFDETTEGLPVGPVDGDADAAPSRYWTYRRVLALPRKPDDGGLGPNPFTGVGSVARLGMLWHDVFGNRLVSDDHATHIDIPIGYRDPLIPLGQWPAVQASYKLSGAAGAAQLAVTFSVDPGRYDPPAENGPSVVQQRAAADAARLTQIYFQLAQPDVGAAITFTVDGGAAHPLHAVDLDHIKTFVVALERFADAVADVAATTSADRLAAALRALVAPADLALPPIAIAATRPPQVIFPLDVQLVVSRQDVDPYFASEPDIVSVASSVRPALATDGDGPLRLTPFAAQFEALLPGLKLASGSASGSGQLYVVQLQGDRLGYAFAPARAQADARFFAPAPLATAPWSATDVDIAPFDADGGLGPPVKKSFRGVDLDTWAADLLGAVDRVLSAQYAAAFRRLDGAAYDKVVRAKKILADAIAARVTAIVGAGGDRAAAAGALRQRLLVSLAEGYRVDTIVQVPLTVVGPGERYRLSFQPRGILPVPEGATLGSLAAAIDVPLELLIALVAGDASLLATGSTVTFQGEQHQVAAGESLRAVAAALDSDEQVLGAALADAVGLVRAGADLGVIKRVYTLARGDTLRTVLDFLAPDVMASGDPADAIADFLDLNHATPGILAAGAKFVFAGATLTIAEGETFDTLAARLQLTDEATLVRALLDTPAILGVSEDAPVPITVSYLARVPAHTLSRADVEITAPGSRQDHMTFLLEMASHAQLDNLPVSLSFTLERLEYAISADVAWAPGFEDSSSLSFVVPPASALGVVDIPIPLRVYPPTPVVDKHAIVVPERPAHPTLAALRAYTYELLYSYTRAAQDHVTLSFTYNQLAIDEPAPRTATDSTLDHQLAQYASIAPALDEALAALPSLPPGDLSSVRAKRAITAVQTFADQVTAVAANWATWQATTATALPAASTVVRVTSDVAGHPQLALTPTSGSSGAAPRVTPVGFTPVFQHAGVHQFASLPGVVPRPDHFHADKPGLDVLAQQSAWGSITVTRNESILPGQPTNDAFVYRIANVRAYSAAVPLISYREPFDMASVQTRVTPAPATKLAACLANFFAELLDAQPGSPMPNAPGLRVAVSFGTLLAGSPSASVGSKANIVSLLPVLMSPAFTFDPQIDLHQPQGLCARLAAQMNDFLATSQPELHGARWVFDVSVYTSLGEDGARARRPPLIELTDVQLLVSDSV